MVRRAIAVGSVAVTGGALAVGGAAALADAAGPTALALSALGALVGIALVVGAGLLYRSDVRTSHTIRIAGWNLLGATLLGLVLALAVGGAGVSLPLFVVVDVLGVSAVAHVLIGYNDVRRIRAEELARQRRSLAVVNRVTRHNLRNDAQVLSATAGRLVEALDDPDLRAAAERVRDRSLELSTIHDELRAFQAALDGDPPDATVELRSVVDRVATGYREEYPDATVETDVPDGLAVRADDQLATALGHLVENALEHGSPDGDGFVRVRAACDGRTARITVEDRGPGVPDEEVAVLAGEREIDQLSHASGLGLWVVRAVAERYGGALDFETTGEGAAVSLTLDAGRT